jgi:hypothetical protein
MPANARELPKRQNAQAMWPWSKLTIVSKLPQAKLQPDYTQNQLSTHAPLANLETPDIAAERDAPLKKMMLLSHSEDLDVELEKMKLMLHSQKQMHA